MKKRLLLLITMVSAVLLAMALALAPRADGPSTGCDGHQTCMASLYTDYGLHATPEPSASPTPPM